LHEFIEYLEKEIANRSPELDQRIRHALVKVTPPHVVLANKTERSL
jgi:hypothetical protein